MNKNSGTKRITWIGWKGDLWDWKTFRLNGGRPYYSSRIGPWAIRWDA